MEIDRAAELKAALEATIATEVAAFERQTGLIVTGVYVPMFRQRGDETGFTVSAKLP